MYLMLYFVNWLNFICLHTFSSWDIGHFEHCFSFFPSFRRHKFEINFSFLIHLFSYKILKCKIKLASGFQLLLNMRLISFTGTRSLALSMKIFWLPCKSNSQLVCIKESCNIFMVLLIKQIHMLTWANSLITTKSITKSNILNGIIKSKRSKIRFY